MQQRGGYNWLASAATNWSNVTAVRINVLARTLGVSPGWTDTRSYDLGRGTLTPPSKMATNGTSTRNSRASPMWPAHGSSHAALIGSPIGTSVGRDPRCHADLPGDFHGHCRDDDELGRDQHQDRRQPAIWSGGRSAAQQGIEQVISADFTSNPVATNVPVDVNGDGKADYTAQVAAPACVATKPIANTQLTTNTTSPNFAADSSCFSGVNNNSDTGILTAAGTPGGMSNCSATQWDVAATVNDANGTAVNTTLHQGVAVRVLTGAACP